jgi:hypothetical protein
MHPTIHAILGAIALTAVTAVPAAAAEGAPVCRASAGYADDFGGRQTYLWRPQWLEALSQRAAADSKFRDALLASAHQAMTGRIHTVTDKTKQVPGAAPNDYASIGPYWWPDPKKKDGLPYIRRDGEVNPERDGPEFDKGRLRALAKDLKALALAYHVNADQAYAQRAATLIRAWFLDAETRMAPNMNFAQGIPGRVDGRGEGIIEASDLSTIIEAAGLIWPSQALSPADKQALRSWYGEFAVWMANSANGEAEMKKTNNHGVFYDFFLAHFALFAGAASVTRDIAEAFPQYRLARQMDRQGRFIAELKRTRSWHYSVFVLDGSARLATIAECVGQNLWEAELADGRSLNRGFEFLDKYSARLAEWPFPDLDLSSGKTARMKGEFDDLKLLFDRAENIPEAFEIP